MFLNINYVPFDFWEETYKKNIRISEQHRGSSGGQRLLRGPGFSDGVQNFRGGPELLRGPGASEGAQGF
jgi:hypothetical protein